MPLLPDSFEPIYFESDSRRRQLLQSGSLGGAPEYTKEEIETAQQMTQTEWDTAIGQGLTLVHFSAQLEPCQTPYTPPNTPLARATHYTSPTRTPYPIEFA